MGWIDVLRRVPLDLGQREVAETTKGKQIALSMVGDGKGRRALDLGAREGRQTSWLRQRGYRVVPADLHPRFADCFRLDANMDLPFPSGFFDLVWCSEVMEHLHDPAHLLKELRRVTHPGGDILLTTPNSYAWLFRVLALFGLTPDRIQRPDHLHFFDLDQIRRLAPDGEVYGYFPYVGIKCTIRRGVGALSPTFVIRIRT